MIEFKNLKPKNRKERKMPNTFMKSHAKENTAANADNEKITEKVSTVVRESEELMNDVFAAAGKKFTKGKERLDDIISDTDKQLRENPWPIVGGVALSCLLLGYIMGHSRHHE